MSAQPNSGPDDPTYLRGGDGAHASSPGGSRGPLAPDDLCAMPLWDLLQVGADNDAKRLKIFASDDMTPAATREIMAVRESCRAVATAIRVRAVAGILAPVGAALKTFSDLGDSAAKMARRTGLSAEAVQALSFAAERSGTDVASLEKGVRRMQRSIYDAGRGLSTTVDALTDLGLTFEDLDGLAPEKQFKIFAEQLSKVEDASKRSAIAQQIFGRSGTMLLPMFEQGAAGVEALTDKFRRFGVALSARQARAAEKFTDDMTDLWTVLKHGVAILGAEMEPAIRDLIGVGQDWLKGAVAWVRNNQELIVQWTKMAVKIAAWVGGIGVGLVVIGKLVGGLASVFSLSKALVGVTAALIANPIALAFAGAAAVIGGTAYALDRYATAHANLADEARKYRTQQDQQRVADLAQMTEVMRDTRMVELSREIGEYRRNIKELRKEQDDIRWKWFGMTPTGRSLNDVGEDIQVQMRRLGQAQRELEQLRTGKTTREALTGGKGSAAAGAGADVAAAEAAAPAKATVDERLEDRLHRLRIQAISDEHKRRLAMIQHEYETERRELEARGAAQEQLDQLRAIRQERLAAEQRRHEAELNRRADEHEKKWQQDRLGALTEERRLKQEIARQEIENTKEGLEREKALLEQKRQAELRRASAAGADLALVNRLYDAKLRALEGSAVDVSYTTTTRGTFNARARGLAASGSVAERTAKASEQTAKNTEDMKRMMQGAGLRFTQ